MLLCNYNMKFLTDNDMFNYIIWKIPKNRARNLIKLGINKHEAWRVAYEGSRIA